MIIIYLTDLSYENDVYPLVKAFYPQEVIKFLEESPRTDRDKRIQNTQDMLETSHKSLEDIVDKELHIKFLEGQVDISLHENGARVIRDKAVLASNLSKLQYKNSMKRILYGILSKASGRELPWGILTGIRPTKIICEMLEHGEEETPIYHMMKTEYNCSDAKIDLSIKIARRELELLNKMDYQKGYSLYIGIPFCPTTCLYCSFTSYSISKLSNLVEGYLDALEKEIRYGATCFPDKKLTTVYFGGGTPTTLSPKQLDRLLRLVRENYDFTYVQEFCVEAGRPDSITKDKLAVLKKWGVNRISINPQSMQQRTLDLIGREHSVREVKEAFYLARETGHDNINMDIILGLPGETLEDVKDTLNQIKELNPESLTVHTLALKRAARLNIEKEEYDALKASGVTNMLEETFTFTKENDYLPYYLYRQKNMADNLENIGYSRYGREGLYNILIMEEKQTILALGAGGMSKFVFHNENRIERVDNVKSVTDYINRIDEMLLRKQNFLKANPQL